MTFLYKIDHRSHNQLIDRKHERTKTINQNNPNILTTGLTSLYFSSKAGINVKSVNQSYHSECLSCLHSKHFLLGPLPSRYRCQISNICWQLVTEQSLVVCICYNCTNTTHHYHQLKTIGTTCLKGLIFWFLGIRT